ncbi:MAG: hypothetical protein ACK4K1_02535 [Flavobacterium sp.]
MYPVLVNKQLTGLNAGLNGWFGRLFRKLSNSISSVVDAIPIFRHTPLANSIKQGAKLIADTVEFDFGFKVALSSEDEAKLNAWYPIFENHYKTILQRISTLNQNYDQNLLNRIFHEIASLKAYYSGANNPFNLSDFAQNERKKFVVDSVLLLENELVKYYQNKGISDFILTGLSIDNLTNGSFSVQAKQVVKTAIGIGNLDYTTPGIIPGPIKEPISTPGGTSPGSTTENQTFFDKNKKWIGFGAFAFVVYQFLKTKSESI